MSIDRLRAHYGFSRMPFGKDLAPGMLHAHGAHAEAVARIGWCISLPRAPLQRASPAAGPPVGSRRARPRAIVPSSKCSLISAS